MKNIDEDARYQIRVLQAQVAALLQALNAANAKLGLPAVQLPQPASRF